MQKADRIARERDRIIQEVAKRPVDGALIGNARIRNGLIIQEKVQPLGKVLLDHGDPKSLIDAYIELILFCWRIGFGKLTYNFTVNHGMDRLGQLMVLDFGEVSFDQSTVRRGLEERLWERAWSFTCDLDPCLRAHFRTAMRDRVNVSTLYDCWGTGQDCQPAVSTWIPDERSSIARADVESNLPWD